MKRESMSSSSERSLSNRLSLPEALRVVADVRRAEDIVITTMGTAREWMKGDVRPLDFVLVPSSMGQATSLGLGLALAQPQRRVIVCNGDGSMLMNLGSLVTVTAQNPPNLTLLLFDNGVYEITGAQATPGNAVNRNGNGDVDFCAMARACGFPAVYEVDEMTRWRKEAENILFATGPVFARIPVHPIPGAAGPRSPSPGPERARQFRTALLGE